MSSKNKIAVLCNNRLAIPAIQSLYSQELLFGIGIPEGNSEIIEILEKLFHKKKITIFVLKKHTFEQDLKKLTLDNTIKYFFTMTFPWKISENILGDNPGRFYNFHYGLLPEMRGADPIFEAIRQQCPKSGISVHAIEKKIDSGAIILKKEIPLDNQINHGILCTYLSQLGAAILPELITFLRFDKGVAQDDTKAKYFKRPDISTVSIDWNQEAPTIDALIRACNPWNKGAYTRWNQWIFRIVEASVAESYSKQQHPTGYIIEMEENTGVLVQCKNNTTLCIRFIYTDETGFISGHKLKNFGIKKGDCLLNL
jgi:methionyl-tRNA formyltransferase